MHTHINSRMYTPTYVYICTYIFKGSTSTTYFIKWYFTLIDIVPIFNNDLQFISKMMYTNTLILQYRGLTIRPLYVTNPLKPSPPWQCLVTAEFTAGWINFGYLLRCFVVKQHKDLVITALTFEEAHGNGPRGPAPLTATAQPHQSFLCWAAASSPKAFLHQRLAGVREQVEISIILFSAKIVVTLPNPTPTKSETSRNPLQGMMHNTCHNVWIPRLSTLVTWVECSKIYSKSELSEWRQPCWPGCYLLAEMVQVQATWHTVQCNKKL